MKIEDVRFGMKVVPHDKTYGRDFSAWASNSPRHKRFLDEHGFLLVECVYFYDGTCSLFDGIDDESRNSVFRSSDFTPAEIEVGDEVRVRGDEGGCHFSDAVATVIWTNKNWCEVEVKNWHDGWGKDDSHFGVPATLLTLVRKAHCIKQEESKEPGNTLVLDEFDHGAPVPDGAWCLRDHTNDKRVVCFGKPAPKAPETVRLAWVRRCATDDLRLYKVPNGADVAKGDTVLTPPQGVKLRGVVDEVRTVSKADAAFMLRGQQPMVVPFLVGKVVTETKEVLFDA